jgi:hypothetical protein
MIFIAFVTWVYNRIQEVAKARRERQASRRLAGKNRPEASAPEWESPYRSTRDEASEPGEPEVPQTFREIFKELEKQFTEPEIEEQGSPTPPPLPPSAETVTPEPESVVPVGEWVDVKTLRTRTAPALVGRRRKKASGGKRTGEDLPFILRDRGRLRNALILKEILEPPRALRR